MTGSYVQRNYVVMSEEIHPIRAYRLAQKPRLSLDSLGADVEVTGATLSRVETGKLPLTVDLAKKLSLRTGISMSVLCPDLAPMFQDQPAEAAQ